MADPDTVELVPVDHNPWEAQTTPWPQDTAPFTAQQRYRAAQAGDESRMPTFQRTGPTLPGMIAQSMEDTGRMMTTAPPPMPKGAYMDAGGPAQGTADSQAFANWLGEMRQRGELAPSMALGMIGGGTAFAPRSALGSAGAKMVQPAVEAATEAAQPGIRAYHGSPHDFQQFDLSKIGTGEGAQAYGHGLYFAEKEGVAKSYRDALAVDPRDKLTEMIQGWTGYRLPGEKISFDMVKKGLGNSLSPELNRLATNDSTVRDVVTYINGHADDLKTVSDEGFSALRRIDKALPPKTPGHMYEVNIGAHPEQFLDWDKTMSSQAPVSAAIAGSRNPLVRDVLNRAGTGENLYRALTYDLGGYPRGAETSRLLNNAGIPGIRYLDQGSRGMAKQADELLKIYGTPERVREVAQEAVKSGSGDSEYWQSILRGLGDRSHNYVVFDPKMIEILKKYGITGAAGGMGAGAMQQQYPLPFQPGM